MNISLVETVLDDSNSLKLNTLTDYTRVLGDFLKFSPKCDIKDYERFLKFKYGFDPNQHSDDFVVKGTIIKYANVLKRFLEKIHNQKVHKVKIEYYKIPDHVNVYPYPKISREEIYRYYNIIVF